MTTTAQGDRASGRHPIWVLLDKLQMDNRDQHMKLVELRAHVASLNLENVETHGQWQPALGSRHPAADIERQIRNGVLTGLVDLEAELAAHPALTVGEREGLRGLLTGKAAA